MTWIRPSVKLVRIIEEADGRRLLQPNGVAVLPSGSVVVADGGNDRICLFNQSGQSLKCIGEKGFGKYRLKEPVGVFVSPNSEVYVADWHNHRIVVYSSNLKYISEFGHYGRIDSQSDFWGRLKSFLGFFTSLASSGTYVERHFTPGELHESKRLRSEPGLLFSGLKYWVLRNGSLRGAILALLAPQDLMDKPNGVAFWGTNIVVSEKNGRCLLVYRREPITGRYRQVGQCFGPAEGKRFGRLANIVYDKHGRLYVCDERASTIWRLDRNFRLIDQIDIGADSGTGQFLPFSCCFLKDELLAVCGGMNFQILHLRGMKPLFCSENIGELHGIAYDNVREVLYVVDREAGELYCFSLTFAEGRCGTGPLSDPSVH